VHRLLRRFGGRERDAVSGTDFADRGRRGGAQRGGGRPDGPVASCSHPQRQPAQHRHLVGH